MDKRKLNKVGCRGYNIDNKIIVSLYIDDGLTMKNIGDKLGISHWTVLDRLKKSGVYKNIKHEINHNIFTTLNKENCYWAGFIAADGWVDYNHNNVGVELQYKDRKHLRNLCSFAGRDKNLWIRNRNKDGKNFKYASISLRSERILEDLKNNFNIVPNKSLILLPPNISNEFNRHFIRGYFDGDGCLGWHKDNKKPRFNIVSGSKNIMIWIKDIISNEIASSGSPSICGYYRNIVSTIEYMGLQVYDILDWLYLDSTENTRLSRKYKRYEKYSKMR